MTDIHKLLNSRFSIKNFDANKKIAPDVWAKIEDALVLTPSSFGLQPWKFLVINNPEVRAQLKPFSWGQAQITDASHLVVFCTKKNMTKEYIEGYMNRIVQVRGVERQTLNGYYDRINKSFSEYQDILFENTKQTFIALGNILTVSALLNVDACAIGGFEDAPYNKILGLEGTEYTSSVVCAFGYRSSEDKYSNQPKVRFEKSKVIEYI